MEQLDFSEAEIEAQLRALGYTEVPAHCLRHFKRDLDQLILHERSSTDHMWRQENSTSPSQLHSCTSPAHAEQNEAPFIRRPFSAAGQLARQVRRGVLYSEMPRCLYAKDGDDSEQLEERDHYARYSVAPSTVIGTLQSKGIGTENGHSLSSQSPEGERAASKSLVFKRKFVRKRSTRPPVCDESTCSEECVSQLEEQLEGLKVSTDLDSELDSESDGASSWDTVVSSGCSHWDTYRSHPRNNIPTQPKSFIQPQFHHRHGKNWKKMDPVTRYFQYRQHWDMFKVPGENKWMELRREIREQMTCSSQPLPNVKRTPKTVMKTSVIPTEKKRLALRWKVRHDLANGIIPAKFTHPF